MDFVDQTYGVHRFRLGLAGEADDDVAREHKVGHDPAGIADQLEVARAGIGAVHRAQHAVIAALDGQVQLMRHMAARRHRVEELGRRVLGLAGHEAHPVVAVDPVDLCEKVGKIIARAEILAVAVDVLTEQRDLFIARRDQLADLAHDLLRLAAAFAAADVGHDAVRAEVVAAVHDAHPRAHAADAVDGDVLCDAARLVVDGKDAAALGVGAVQELGEAPLGLRTEHEIDVAVAGFHLFRHARLLCHAPAQADDLVGIRRLGVRELAEHPVNGFLRVFADGAGVHQHDVGALRVVGELAAHLAQHSHQPLAVRHVLLTAVGVDVGQRLRRAPLVQRAHLIHIFLLPRRFLGADQYLFSFQGVILPVDIL